MAEAPAHDITPTSSAKLRSGINIFLLLFLALNFALWMGSHHTYPRWAGVPPAPSKTGALMMALGDPEFSYRTGALTLQDLGDPAGQSTPLKDYDYEALSKWFWLLNDLDPASNDVPMTVAYYFGATRVPKDDAIVVDYLATVGQAPFGNKWRWLLHAIFLARHRLYDLNLALDLSYKLAKMNPVGDTLPMWARNMPAMILHDKGDKDGAKKLIENMISSGDHLYPNDVNFMKGYLIDSLGASPEEVDALLKERHDKGLDKPETYPILPAPTP